MCDRIPPRQEIRFTPTTLGKWLSPLILVLGVVCTGEGTVAQIVPDETLGNERSIVTPLDALGLPVDRIDGGAIRGANLFHSFEEFNVGANRNAFFFSPNADIQNILARVTGGNPSEILGVLGTFGNSEPNLFLMNPRGIVFGPNARLAVGGSFVASTADSLVFENGFEFGATNPEAPPLLTINVPVGLQYGANPGRIVNQSRAVDINGNLVGLGVQPEKTLALIGGEVDLEGGVLSVPDGRIELGSVAGNSLVSLLPTDGGYTFDYDRVQGFQDIQLSQTAGVGSSGGDNSSIQLQGRNITLTEGSQIVAFTQGLEVGGNINVNASESVELIGGGLFALTLGPKDGGNLTLKARQLLVRDGAAVSAGTVGGGNGGTLTVEVEELVQLVGTGADGSPSSINAEALFTGNGGNLTLKAQQLLVQDGATVSTRTEGEGNGGTLTVEVSDLVELVGTTPDGLSGSGIAADTTGKGNGGNLTLIAGRLLVRDGANVSASTRNEGNGGNINVEVADLVQLVGTTPNGQSASGIAAETTGKGNGGNLTLIAGRLLVQDGAGVSVNTFDKGDGGTLTVEVENLVQLIGSNSVDDSPSSIGATAQGMGDGGNLILRARQLQVQDGAVVSASAGREGGDGGTLLVDISDSVELIGTSPNGSPSGIGAETQGAGDGGNLTLKARQLLVREGARVSVSTFGQGNSGTLLVEVSDLVQLTGSPSGIFAATGNRGNGGNLTLKTRQLLVQDGANVAASTFGEGNGGTLILDVSESVLLDEEAAMGAISEASGNAGDLILTTDQLTVQNGSAISVSSPDSLAGNLTITANTLSLNNGEVSAETGVTGAEEGANIILQDLDLLLLENESLISATALEDANGGNVTINADFIVAKSPTGPEGSDITANAVRGNGGRVSVTSEGGLFGIEFRPQRTPLNDITVSSQFGVAGDFIDNTPGIDPSEGLATLPSNLVDPESLIDRSCSPGGAALQSSFIITGRGGIPTSPTEPLSSNDVVSEWVTLDTEAETPEDTETPTNPTSTTPQRIIEARGWVKTAAGQIVLVADTAEVTSQNAWQTAPSCEDIETK